MNLFDWYFKQLVSQGDLDQAFLWAQEADQYYAVDTGATGIVAGGAVSEQIPTPDMTVNVSALSAYGKAGERITVDEPTTVVDVSVDEYGTSTTVGTSGHERIVSVFVRFHLDLIDPKVDGNGLTVYSKQYEGAEIFVRMGATAPAGTAVPPALLPSALLLCDITLAYGQTAVINANISVARREDWIRQEGTTIVDFSHGTAREAIVDLFGYVDTLMGGGLAFSYTDTWFGGVAVGLGTPPTTFAEAFNAIPSDLADVTLGGAKLLGTTAAPGWALLLLSTNVPISPGVITNEDGGTATVYQQLAGSPGYVLVHALTGTWNVGAGVDQGATYSAPPDAYYMGKVDISTILTASTSLQDVLLQTMEEVAARPRLDLNAPVTGKRFHYQGVHNERYHVPHCDVGGAGDPLGAIEALENAPRLQTGGQWGLPYFTYETFGTGFNAVDLCRGWDYERNAHCVYICGDVTDIRKVFLDPDGKGGTFSGFLLSEYGELTIDTSGTLLSTLSNHEPFAVACNGKYLYVLCQTSASGATAKVYCYDVRYWTTSGPLKYVWDTAVPSTTSCMGTRKADSRLMCDKDYVWGLLGAEDANSGTPLFRMDAATGLNPTLGLGDGVGSTGYSAMGGLAITQGNVLFYTVTNGTLHYVVPATGALASTGKGAKQLAGECRDVIVPGWYAVCPCFTGLGNTYFNVQAWDYANNVLFNGIHIDNVYDGTTYDQVLGTYDGSRMWFKFCDEYGRTAENHAIVGMHPAQIVNPTSGARVLACEDRYAISQPQTTGSIGTMGRLCAWGPGLWSIEVENASDQIEFLPLNRTFK